MTAQVLAIEAKQSSGRLDLPPDYTWVDQGYSCIAYLWVGGRENGITHHIYDLSYQVQHGSRKYLGQIVYNPHTKCWEVDNVQRHILPAAECLCYSTWKQAAEYVWDCYQATQCATKA